MADIIRVTITEDSLQVIPGESATIGITVQNGSNVVDVLYIAVEGLDPSWYQLSVVQSSLFPGDETTGTLTLTPPKTSDAVAKNYPFIIKTTSQKDPTQATSLAVDLEVQAFHSFEMDLHPQKATGARGSYTLSIKNTGNADLNIDLAGRDPEDLCRFTFDHQRPRVFPGQEFEVAVQVEPGKRPFRGRPKAYSLTLTGTPDSGTAEPASVLAGLDATARLPGVVARVFGTVLRRPRAPRVMQPARRLPRWAKIAAGVAVAVIVLVVVLVVALAGGDKIIYEHPFLIDPGKTITLGFEVQDAETARITAEADWAKSNDALAVAIQRPGSDAFSDALPISSSGGSVSFLVDAATAQRGLSGWVISVTNTSASEQADGILKISFSK